MTVRIFHGPNNIAGAAGVIAKAQRYLGFKAEAVCYDTGVYRYPSDRLFKKGMLNRAKSIIWEGMRHDIFHFYFGQSLAGPSLLDVRWLKRLGKKIYFYFCGCDIRDAKTIIATQTYSACSECWPVGCSSNRKLAIEISGIADGVFISTPDLFNVLPGAIWLPQPIEMEKFEEMHQLERKQVESFSSNPELIRIAHAPSCRMLKGSRYLEAAVDSLQNEGWKIELNLIENMSHTDAMHACLIADLVVDQLLIGAYGQFSVEMMAMRKPVICYIREDLRHCYPETMPIVSANPDTIKQVIRDMVENRQMWQMLGEKGIEYVRKYHSSIAVASIALKHYCI